MSDAEKSFVDSAEEHSELMSGVPASMDDMAKDFALYGLPRRVEMIKKFRASLETGEISSEASKMHKYLRDREQLKRMEEIHHTLRRAKR